MSRGLKHSSYIKLSLPTSVFSLYLEHLLDLKAHPNMGPTTYAY